MRIIVYGVGAIGGTVAAALALAGHEVVGIARGAQLDAMRDNGLLLRTPEWSKRARFASAADPTEITFRSDDLVFLTMKTQDTLPALKRLREAGATDQPIFCAQNGVANERFALRLFPNVYGVTVMMPADYILPGEINCYSVPRHGIFDVGRYPSGSDKVADDAVALLDSADIAAFEQADVMAGKHGKLLLNLRNILEAALGPEADSDRLYAAVRAEAEAVYRAAGIVATDVGGNDPRCKQLMQMREIEGRARTGGSSTQSLKRGAGSIETDYLNGEIVLVGRLHGVPTPANAWLCRLGARMVREKLQPGTIGAAEIEAGLKAAGVVLQS